MGIVASARNLRKEFQFAIIVDGLDIAYVQNFTLPELEWEVIEHGGAGSYWNSKERGRLKVTNAELEKTIKAEGVDDFIWTELMKPYGLPPVGYQKDWTVCELSHSGSYVRQWVLNNAWVFKGGVNQMKGMGGENLIEKASVACEFVDFTNL